jgi:hypothetical protein
MEDTQDKRFGYSCSPLKIFQMARNCENEPLSFRGRVPRQNGGAEMAEFMKEKRHSDTRTPDEETRKRETPEVCEICGQKMERDPESGEYFCPDCYYSEDKA